MRTAQPICRECNTAVQKLEFHLCNESFEPTLCHLESETYLYITFLQLACLTLSTVYKAIILIQIPKIHIMAIF